MPPGAADLQAAAPQLEMPMSINRNKLLSDKTTLKFHSRAYRLAKYIYMSQNKPYIHTYIVCLVPLLISI